MIRLFVCLKSSDLCTKTRKASPVFFKIGFKSKSNPLDSLVVLLLLSPEESLFKATSKPHRFPPPNRMFDKPHRIWIWLKRFRKRKGYGVHSPFAFHYITELIYDKQKYEAYRTVKAAAKKRDTNRKSGRLLFRISQRIQPKQILFLGDVESRSLMYIRLGQPDAMILDNPETVNGSCFLDMAFFNIESPQKTEESVVAAMKYAGKESQFIIHGIHSSKQSLAVWKRLMKNAQSGITFDLWDLGIILFDKSYIKQDYIVNF